MNRSVRKAREIIDMLDRDDSAAIILAANRPQVLKPGMTGVAKVYCGRTIVSHILLRDLIRFIRTEFWL